MPAPYSMDLREKIVAVFEKEKISYPKLAKRFHVSLNSVKRYLNLAREWGDVSPILDGKGRPGKIDDRGHKLIEKAVRENPTITLAKLSKIYYQTFKVKTGSSILSRACQKLGLGRKKLSLYASERDHAEVKKRKAYLAEIKDIPLKALIFLDESGANLGMSLLSAISSKKIEAAWYGEWSTDGSIFLEFIERNWCPLLKKGQVVIMDNVSFHKVAGVREAIEKVGARLIYLPPYSPDLNPIEFMWSKIKTGLRRSAARTVKEFAQAVSKAYYSISASDLKGWYEHCGLGSTF